MTFSLRGLVEVVAAAGTICCLAFYTLATIALVSFLRWRKKNSARAAAQAQWPAVSILKPLKGVDPEIWESFCSHCEQDYPEFELIFGVNDADDPACDVVRRLQQAYPNMPVRLLVCDQVLGANRKVSNLAQMAKAARYDVLVVNDSDIRVARDYLKRIVAPLADSGVGLVTCLYRGVPATTLGSRLEALGIGTDFALGVLSARFLEGGIRFGLGSTLAFRRGDLAASGGFEALTDYLADDYELGRRIAAKGKRVELSGTTVATFLPAYSFAEFWQHQLRWARTIRDARRGGYVGLLFTFGLPWALAALIASRGAGWAWALFAMTLLLRVIAGSGAALAALRDQCAVKNAWLFPLRDLIAPLVWFGGLFGNRIHWRGDAFVLRDGKLTRVDAV